jgi:oligopeptide/dipeptide ABC transporter ATP-binding protein
MADGPVLKVRGLVTHFFVSGGVVKAVDGVDLEIGSNEIVAIVGESGSGKSVTALSIMRLIAEPGRILAGEVIHQGKDLLKLSLRQIQEVRGNSISMVFQNPHASLHPLLRIGRHMEEAIMLRTRTAKTEARRQAAAMLEHIGVEDPAGVLKRYPFEVSAGVSQRVMLAMALMTRPQLLIADEPTTNLDALAQIQFLRLVRKMRDELRMSVLLITHDFGVVSMLADRVVVMYAGKQMEAGDADSVLRDPQHPYSAALLNSVRVLGARASRRLEQIPGEVPDVMRLPPGCSFRPRCRYADAVCHQTPPQVDVTAGHAVRCWRHVRH